MTVAIVFARDEVHRLQLLWNFDKRTQHLPVPTYIKPTLNIVALTVQTPKMAKAVHFLRYYDDPFFVVACSS